MNLLQPPADLTSQAIADRCRAVYRTILITSPRIRTGNFTAIAADDLARMFDLYDQAFFAGIVRKRLEECGSPLTFDVSPRLTRSGGLTKQFRPRGTPQAPRLKGARYEILLSGPLLRQTFRDVQRKVVVNGLECSDRLEAALRIFEHELIHLVEMLETGGSSCDAALFKVLAHGYFGHTHTKHDLVTQHERAREQFALKVGDRVRFELGGREYVGVVNRITQRATVLVEDENGQPYRDGKRYLKFYVPLTMLRRV